MASSCKASHEATKLFFEGKIITFFLFFCFTDFKESARSIGTSEINVGTADYGNASEPAWRRRVSFLAKSSVAHCKKAHVCGNRSWRANFNSCFFQLNLHEIYLFARHTWLICNSTRFLITRTFFYTNLIFTGISLLLFFVWRVKFFKSYFNNFW